MALTHSGTSGLNQYPVDYQLMRNLLVTAKTRAPFFAPCMPGQLIKNAGTDSVKWERIENLTVQTTALTELTTTAYPTRTAEAAQITPVTAQMLKYGNFLEVTEELDMMSVNSTSAKLSTVLGENAGASYNAILAAVFQGATNVARSNGAGTANVNTVINDSAVRTAYNHINRNSGLHFMPEGYGSQNIGTSPIRAAYMGVCHVDVEEDVRNLTGFVPVESYAGYTQAYPYEFGTVGGVRWVSTELTTLIDAGAGAIGGTNVRETTTNADVYDSFVVAMDAVGAVGLGENHAKEIYRTGDRIPAVEVIYHQAGSAGSADPLNEISTLGWKGWLVGKILNADWIVKIESAATDYAI